MSLALVESGLDYCRLHHGIREQDEHACDNAIDDEIACETCEGDGQIGRYLGEGETEELPCPACDGQGVVACDLTPLLYASPADNASREGQT